MTVLDPAPPRTAARSAALAALVVAICLVLGGVESFAQTVLPEWLRPLSNSASGWTLPPVVLIALFRLRPVPAVVAGALGFVALTVGYAVVSTLRGFADDPVFWASVGIVVGPFVGLAACWLRSTGARAALGAGLLAGIGLGEGVYGLSAITATTGVVYWAAIAAVAVVLLAVVAVLRVRRGPLVALEAATALVVGAAFLAAFRLL